MARIREWWYRRTHDPFDWWEQIPEWRDTVHVHLVSRWPV
jgi:hypothetical protein